MKRRMVFTLVSLGFLPLIFLTQSAAIATTAGPANSATSHSDSSRVASGSGALTAADVDMVNAVGPYLSSQPGSVVSVLRGPGADVWNAVSPGASTIDTTPEVLAHNFLLVTCVDHPNQSGWHAAPGTKVPTVVKVQAVIDESTGHVLQIRRVAQSAAVTDSVEAATAKFGTPATMTLSAASFR